MLYLIKSSKLPAQFYFSTGYGSEDRFSFTSSRNFWLSIDSLSHIRVESRSGGDDLRATTDGSAVQTGQDGCG